MTEGNAEAASVRTFLCCLILLLLVGCGDSKSKLITVTPGLEKVQEAVVRFTGHSDCGVTQSTGSLYIYLVNSSHGSLPDPERKAQAKEIARVGWKACATKDPLQGVEVFFVQHTVHYDQTDFKDSFRFEKDQL